MHDAAVPLTKVICIAVFFSYRLTGECGPGALSGPGERVLQADRSAR